MRDIVSSPNDIQLFVDSSIHSDYLKELNLRIEETTIMLDDFDSHYTGRQYDMFRGRKRNLIEMKQLFLDMIINKATDLELEEGESVEGEDDV